MKTGGTNKSPEIHRLASSIAGLVVAITEIINAKVKEAHKARAGANAELPLPASQPVPIVRWIAKMELDERFKYQRSHHGHLGNVPAKRMKPFTRSNYAGDAEFVEHTVDL
jgi:hypothetical protein